MNDKIEKVITKDPERFNLVRKMWDMMLTGNYTPPKILEIANNDWGLRTIRYKKEGGKELSVSGIYRMFTNLFYAGILEWDGHQYEGKHEPMITLEEYDRVQAILGREGRPRPQRHDFAFTGAMRCGVCNCFYTADTRKKLIKKTGEMKEFSYYHCTRRTKRVKCNQNKGIAAADLELSIEREIEKYTILPEFLGWALEGLNKNNDTEIENTAKIYEAQHAALGQAQKELGELTKMRYRQLIDDEAFLKEKTKLQATIAQMKGKVGETEARAEQWLELTEKTFCFATYARKAFITAKGKEGLELKKEILLALGKTPIMQDKKLTIEPNEWLVPIKDGYPALEKEYRELELNKTLTNTARNEALASIRTRWGALLDAHRTCFREMASKC